MIQSKLKKLYGLDDDDFFYGDRMGIDESYTIITKSGVRKIAEKINLKIEDVIINQVIDANNQAHVAIVIKGYTEKGKFVEIGEASPGNNNFPYPVSVALKRSKSRLVLQAAGLDKVISDVELSSIQGLINIDLKNRIKEAVSKNKKG